MVLIIDYGMGNTGSVKRALEECGADQVLISHYEEDFDRCTRAILPGVGSFADAMKNLQETGLVKRIQKLAVEDKIPFLGICLGMQLLASTSDENGPSQGLNLIPGDVKMLQPLNGERIPHVGWNELEFENRQNPILEGIKNRSDFYFVHSYHFIPKDKGHILTNTPYCGRFASMVYSGNIIGTQFHPEKSSTTGFRLLTNFLNM